MEKQSMYDFLKERKKSFAKIGCSTFLDTAKERLCIKYPSGFEWEFRAKDFPCRNLYPCYIRIDGKSVITHWEDGEDATPGISMQKFLDSGEARYVPKYEPANKQDIKMLPNFSLK